MERSKEYYPRFSSTEALRRQGRDKKCLPWVSYLRTASKYLAGRFPHWNTESATITLLWRATSALPGSADGDLEKKPKLSYNSGTVSGNCEPTRCQHVWISLLETFAYDMFSLCFTECLWTRMEWRLSAASCFRAFTGTLLVIPSIYR